MGTVGEQKTKPTQHSVKELRAIGIQPDILVARCKEPLEESIRRKISLFCDVPIEAVVTAADARSIYDVPDGPGGAEPYRLRDAAVRIDGQS